MGFPPPPGPSHPLHTRACGPLPRRVRRSPAGAGSPQRRAYGCTLLRVARVRDFYVTSKDVKSKVTHTAEMNIEKMQRGELGL